MDIPAFDELDVGVDGAIATLVFDRPAVLNALSVELLDEVVAACDWLGRQASIRVVVVRGAGRTFSSGADLATIERLTATDGTARAAAGAGDRAASAIEALPQVTVAAIHGRCVGGGIVLALACDLRVASDAARFSIPEVDLGIPLAWGGLPRLLREVGPGVARDLVLTCREVDAAEARSVGLVSRVVGSDDLDGHVSELARELAAKAPLPVRATLDAVAALTGLGAPHGWSDGDTLLASLADPASRAAADAYLRRIRGGRP